MSSSMAEKMQNIKQVMTNSAVLFTRALISVFSHTASFYGFTLSLGVILYFGADIALAHPLEIEKFSSLYKGINVEMFAYHNIIIKTIGELLIQNVLAVFVFELFFRTLNYYRIQAIELNKKDHTNKFFVFLTLLYILFIFRTTDFYPYPVWWRAVSIGKDIYLVDTLYFGLYFLLIYIVTSFMVLLYPFKNYSAKYYSATPEQWELVEKRLAHLEVTFEEKVKSIESVTQDTNNLIKELLSLKNH